MRVNKTRGGIKVSLPHDLHTHACLQNLKLSHCIKEGHLNLFQQYSIAFFSKVTSDTTFFRRRKIYALQFSMRMYVLKIESLEIFKVNGISKNSRIILRALL